MYKIYFDHFVLPYGRSKKLLMVMKLTTLLLLFAIMQVSAMTYAQKVSLNVKNSSLSNVLDQISDQTGYNFFYSNSAFNDTRPVSLNVRNAELKDVLQQIFAGQALGFTIQDKTVVIKEKNNSPLDNIKSQLKPELPAITLLGKITDERGNPLMGVNIKVRGSSFGWTTNSKGEFVAVIATPNAMLQISFIGYITQEMPANQLRSPAVIVLKEDISKLDEIRVIAYGTTTKRLSTGDQTSISAATIAKYPTNNVLDVLQGSVPGLAVYKNTGNPGSSYRVQLRGTNGVKARPPLYIVDGVPLESGGFATQNSTLGGQNVPNASGQGGDALSFINPLDIESVDVLKDASATAIYGTRAADGVIIITTKKGKQGSMKAEVNFYTGYTAVNHFPDMLNLQQYLQMRKEAKKNDNTPVYPSDYDLNGVWDTTRNTNWSKKLLGGMGHLINAQAAISGGTNNIQYRISTGYNRQTNLTDLNGSNQTANLNFSVTSKTDDNKFSMQLNGGYTYNLSTIPPSDLTFSRILAPDAPELYNPDGTLNFENNTFTNNPLTAKNLLNNTTGTGLISNAVLSYRPVSGLEFKATLGYNKQQVNEFLGTPSSAFGPTSLNKPYSNFTNTSNSYWSIEPQINYNTDISKGKLSVIIGSSLQKRITESTLLQVTGYSSDLLLRSISAGTSISNISAYSYLPYKLNSLFGRVGYNWDNKYLIDISGRDDGSSHFGANHQFHLFSAVGAGWIFSEENLIKKNLNFLNYGKLRGSYGVTGRDNITAYQYLDTYGVSGTVYQGITGLLPSGLPNANLSWESTAKAEISLELQFLNGRINFESNFYRNRTTNILINNPLSGLTGFASILQNLPAVVQNQGFDLTLTGYSFRKTNFTWSTTVLFTRDRNKLLSYPGLAKSGFASQFIIGQPVSLLHVYSFAGVNPQTGTYQFNSKSGAVVSSPTSGTDNFKTLDTSPDFYGSVQNSFKYKQFTLDFLFRFIKQIGLNAFGQLNANTPGLSASNSSVIVLNRWQKPGDITDIQRYGTNINLLFSQLNAIQTDHAYGDASYIRLQNLSLAYTFPQLVIKKLHVQNLQVYVQGDNLLTISRYGAIDPENQSALVLPPLRMVTAGLRLSL